VEKLKDIIDKHIKPNQVVLIGTVNENGETDVSVAVSGEKHPNPETEKLTYALGMAFSGAMAKMGRTESVMELIQLGIKVVAQQTALEEAQKE
jgi:hypothetical protein